MTDLRELLRPRVERGAALLDSVEPYWWKRIEEELRLSDCKQCVLGQVYGHYNTGLNALADTSGEYIGAGGEYGFAAVWPEASTSKFWPTLDELWLEAIAGRRRS